MARTNPSPPVAGAPFTPRLPEELVVADGPRERLLAAAVAHVAEHGLGDLSLRGLAAGIGTSHRMLIYHFGSKEELLVEMVRALESGQRELVEAIIAEDPDAPIGTIMRKVWRQVADPALDGQVRLFFEVFGQALRDQTFTAGVLEGMVDDWLVPMTQIERRRGTPAAEARANVRIGVALMRGLLLDLLASGDRRGVDAAFEHFLRIFEAPRA